MSSRCQLGGGPPPWILDATPKGPRIELGAYAGVLLLSPRHPE